MVRSDNPVGYSGIMSAREASSVYRSVSNDKSPTDAMLGAQSRSFGMGSMGSGSIDEREKPPASPPRNSGIPRRSSLSQSEAAGSPPSSPRHMTRDCDFDKNPTKLYLMIQEKRWDDAVKQANLSPNDASTWVSRREKDGKLRWRLLPIHAAVIFKAPERAIEGLLCSFPGGAQCKDDQGMLPIHLAFRNGSSEGVVNLLLVAYPQSIDVRDRKGRIPLVLAQASSSPNRDAFIRALERGPAYYAVAAAATERTNVTVEQRAICDTKLIEMQKEHAREMEALKESTAAEKKELENELAEEFARFQRMAMDDRTDAEGEIQKLKEEMEIEIERVKQESESEVEKVRQEMESEAERLKQEAESEVEKVKQEMALEGERARETEVAENSEAQEKLKSLEDKLVEMEAELAKTQDTSQVLVDHVNSLEGQLKNKEETEEFLTNRISTLEKEKEDLNGQQEYLLKEISTEKDGAIALAHQEKDDVIARGLQEKDDAIALALKERDEAIAQAHQEKEDTIALNNALKEKLVEKEEDLKRANSAIVHQETHVAHAISTREDEKKLLGTELKKVSMELATARANTTVLETQLKKKIQAEQALASQVSDMANKLTESLATAQASSATYVKRIEILERERSDLKKTVEHLTSKLSGVAGALDGMATEQERIVGAAERHEATMKAATVFQKKVVEDAARQDQAIEAAKREREEIVQLLAEQADDMDRQVEERKKILDAVTAQEEEIEAAAEERYALIERVTRQKQTMMALKDSELGPLIDSGNDILQQTKSSDIDYEREQDLIKTTTEGEAYEAYTSACSATASMSEREQGTGLLKMTIEGEAYEAYTGIHSATASMSSTEHIANGIYAGSSYAGGGYTGGSGGSVAGSLADSSTAGSRTPELKTAKAYSMSASSMSSAGQTTNLSVVSSTPGSVSELRAAGSTVVTRARSATPERQPRSFGLASNDSMEQFANLSMMSSMAGSVSEVRAAGNTVTGSLAGYSHVPELKSIRSLEEEEQMRKEAEELEEQLAQLKENHAIYSVVPDSPSLAGGVPPAPPANEY